MWLLAPVVALTLVGLAQPALASCAPPAPLAESVRRADAVIHGRVTAISGRALEVAVVRALKGSVAPTIRVYVGPGRSVGATSVDYTFDHRAGVGTEHVLFIMKVSGGYETNACNGSHPGGPNPEELAFFGAATTPGAAASPAPTSGNEPAADLAPLLDVRLLALAAAAGLAAAALGFMTVRRLRQI